MAKTNAELRAQRKYARTPKGKESLDEAHKKRANTEEYWAYQREKQREYRRRRKLEASGEAQAQMGINELLSQKREDILRIAAQHGASNVRIFGSVARGEAKPDSDVDFLVELESERSLLDHVALIQDLSDLLGRKVDVATDKGLREHIREAKRVRRRPDRIINEAMPL